MLGLKREMALHFCKKNTDAATNTTFPEGFPSSTEINDSPLFRSQSQINPLPIPALHSTLSKLKGFIRALEIGSGKSTSEVDALIAEFENKEGPILQALLEARAGEKKTSFGWFYEWWNDYAYLRDRSPLAFYVSYFYAFKDQIFSPFLSGTNTDVERQCRIAALLASAAIKMKEKIMCGSLEPDRLGSAQLCSHMYKYVFNACRIPRKPYDTTLVFDLKKNSHLVVLYKNAYYKIEGYNRSGTLMRSLAEIEGYILFLIPSDLFAIVSNHKDNAGDIPNIGIFTAVERDSATEGISLLEKASVKNRENLEIIRTASCVLCLDDTSPQSLEERCHSLWHGNGQNRFFDKSIQFIVSQNGHAGLLGEHSMMDGTITNRLCSEMVKEFPSFPLARRSTETFKKEPHGPFTWDINESITQLLNKAKFSFEEHRKVHLFSCLLFEHFGKSDIKKWKLSPDSFMQMAFQLAYYRFSGKLAASYEAAQTRAFAFGRTDVVRSPSLETTEWIRAMDDPSVGPTTKLFLLEKAIQSHSGFAREAAAGKGIDRHLLGLSLIAENNSYPIPKLFQNELFMKSKKWVLSTSQITADHNDAWGYGEVVADGFGLPYSIYDDHIYVGVSSRSSLNADTEKFKEILSKTLLSMSELIKKIRGDGFASMPSSSL
ncbi:Carnitine O-acetyltransferase mitochondrial [Mitosporidium daphniae]